MNAPRTQRPVWTPRAALGLAPAACLALAAPAALADDWDVTIGAGVGYGSAYEGSDEREVSPIPILDVTYNNRFFLSTQRGLGAYAVNHDDDRDGGSGGLVEEYFLGVSARPDFGRAEDDDDRLRGMGDVDLTAEIGAFGGFGVGPVEFEGEIYHDVADGHGGLRGEISASVGGGLPSGFALEAGPFASFGDSTYLESYFGVTDAQSARSGLARYDAGSGLYAVGVEAMARYQFDDHWAVGSIAEYARIVGDAADSPIVEEENSFEFGGFLTYSF